MALQGGRLGLPERLHSRGEYLRIQGQGRKFRGQLVTLMVGRPRPPLVLGRPGQIGAAQAGAPSASGANGEHLRVGYTVSRKVGIAVVRNRVRRALKEIVRLHPEHLARGMDHVLVAHPRAAEAPSQALREEVTCLLQRAQGWASQQPSCTPASPCIGPRWDVS